MLLSINSMDMESIASEKCNSTAILHQSEIDVSFSGLITPEPTPRTTQIILNGLFLWILVRLGHKNDSKLTQTEGSEDKHSCGAGVA
jgi:hypothetical protein